MHYKVYIQIVVYTLPTPVLRVPFVTVWKLTDSYNLQSKPSQCVVVCHFLNYIC